MKKANLIALILLGVIFVVFGLNYFLKFIKMPPMSGPPAQFMGALAGSGYLTVVKLIEIAGGALLLTRRYAPLGLALLGPVVVNIVLFDIFLVKQFNPLGAAVAVLWLFLMWTYRKNFTGIFAAPRGA